MTHTRQHECVWHHVGSMSCLELQVAWHIWFEQPPGLYSQKCVPLSQFFDRQQTRKAISRFCNYKNQLEKNLIYYHIIMLTMNVVRLKQ